MQEKLSDILQALASLAWPAIVAFLIIQYRQPLRGIFLDVGERIRRGASVKFWNFEIKGALITATGQSAEAIGADVFLENVKTRPASKEDFEHRRNLRYGPNFVHLVHIVSLSGHKDYPFSVSVYVRIEEVFAHYERDTDAKPARMNDIRAVEYYMGHYFGEDEYGSWFIIEDPTDGFAVRYLTNDEVTCVARIHFQDGKIVELPRFLDLEMGKRLRDAASRAQVSEAKDD